MIGQMTGKTNLYIMMKYVFIVFSLICTTNSFAQIESTEDPIDIRLKQCLDSGNNQSTFGMARCTFDAGKQWDQELNKYYGLLMSALSPEGKIKLKDSQRLWISYRDKEIEFAQTLYYNLEGTVWRIAFAERSMELTKQRALELKAYYQDLQ